MESKTESNNILLSDSSLLSEKKENQSNIELNQLSEEIKELDINKNKKENKKQKHQTVINDSKTLIKKLHERFQLLDRVHTAIVRGHTNEGFLLDLIVYDKSEIKPKLYPQSKKHENTIPSQSKQVNKNINYPRYVINAVIKWESFPKSIQEIPLHERKQSSAQYFAAFSIVNVFCKYVDMKTKTVYVKIANRSSPRFVLPNDIDKTLSFCTDVSPPHISPHYQGLRPRFLIIIDFEATCDFSPNPVVTAQTSEIIEFPWVVIDTVTLNIVHERRIYVKPDNINGITNYCTRLTGITVDDCKDAIPLKEAIQEFNTFIMEYMYPYGAFNFRIVTDSVWDLQVQLRQECQRKNIPLEWWFSDYFDLREEFRHFYAWIPFLKRDPPLFIMLNAFDLPFFGRHHSGLDDCKTIAQVVKVLLQLYPRTFTSPKSVRPDYDPMKDNSWVSFMSDCPQDSWLCTNKECSVYNKPTFTVCRFCKSEKPSE